MPYKCLQCDKIVDKVEEQTCQCKTPRFMKCEKVHFLHPEGPGKALATRQVAVGLPKKLIKQELRLACNAQDVSPIASGYEPTVTCTACLQYIKSIQPSPEE